MGNYIAFEIPNTEASYTYVLIQRSLQQSAQYSALVTQTITNNTYFDETGTSDHWYRMRFYDDTNEIYTSYSDPFQSDDEYYCTSRDVASFMGRSPFTDSTNPTRYEVEEIIKDVCDEIDERTHDAWRKTLVTNETHDVRIQDRYQGYGAYPYDYSTRIALYLKHRDVRAFTSGTHKIEVWDGTNWVDFITTYTEGRAQDYWINYERGIIYFVNHYPLRQRSNVRVTYAYGKTEVHGDIRRAAILLTAAHIIGGKEDLNVVYPQSTMGTVLDTPNRWDKWMKEAEDRLKRQEQFLTTRYY
jgi:hypothetical protein